MVTRTMITIRIVSSTRIVTADRVRIGTSTQERATTRLEVQQAVPAFRILAAQAIPPLRRTALTTRGQIRIQLARQTGLQARTVVKRRPQ